MRREIGKLSRGFQKRERGYKPVPEMLVQRRVEEHLTRIEKNYKTKLHYVDPRLHGREKWLPGG
jgi:tRNA 2-selenouridine synthase SelU